jgi:hypothetical protein
MAAAATATGTGTGALTAVLPPCPARASTFRRAQVRPHRLPTLRCRRARPLTTAAAAASSSSSSPVFHGECFVVGENIDTDQIIPAEHLTLVPSKPDEYRKLGSDRPQPENDCLVIILISSCWPARLGSTAVRAARVQREVLARYTNTAATSFDTGRDRFCLPHFARF